MSFLLDSRLDHPADKQQATEAAIFGGSGAQQSALGLDQALKAWRKVAHSGHVNKYALFAELCFRHAKPDGIVALVIPSSFRAGPLRCPK